MDKETHEAKDMFQEWTKRKNLVPLPFSQFDNLQQLEHFLHEHDCDTALWGVEPRTCSVAKLFCDLRNKQCALMLEVDTNVPKVEVNQQTDCCARDQTNSCDDNKSQETHSHGPQIKNLVRCVFNLRLRLVDVGGNILVEMNQESPSLVTWHTTQVIDEDPIQTAERYLRQLTGMNPRCRLSNSTDEEEHTSESTLFYTPLQFESPHDYSKFSTSFPTLETHYRINILTIQLSPKSLVKFFDAVDKGTGCLTWITEHEYSELNEHRSVEYDEDNIDDVRTDAVVHGLTNVVRSTSHWKPQSSKTMTVKKTPSKHFLTARRRLMERHTVTSWRSQSALFWRINRAVSNWFSFSSNSNETQDVELPTTQLRGAQWYIELRADWAKHNQKHKDKRKIAAAVAVGSKATPGIAGDTIKKFAFDEVVLEQFDQWLTAFNLDTSSYTPSLLARLLEELLSNQSELLVHRTAPKTLAPGIVGLERALRIVKLSVFDARHGSPQRLCQCGECSGQRQAVLQKFTLPVSPTTGEPLYRPEDHEFLVDPEFIVCVNSKAAVDELVLDVAKRTIKWYFGEYNTKIAHVRMCTPIEESNLSPSYPGLQTTYYLHHVHVYLHNLPSTTSFISRPHGKGLLFYWEWMARTTIAKLENRENIIDHFLSKGHGIKSILNSLKLSELAVGGTTTTQEADSLTQVQQAIVERRSMMSMLARELRQAAKRDHAATVKYLVNKINYVGRNRVADETSVSQTTESCESHDGEYTLHQLLPTPQSENFYSTRKLAPLPSLIRVNEVIGEGKGEVLDSGETNIVNDRLDETDDIQSTPTHRSSESSGHDQSLSQDSSGDGQNLSRDKSRKGEEGRTHSTAKAHPNVGIDISNTHNPTARHPKHQSSNITKTFTFALWTSAQHRHEILAALEIALTYNSHRAAIILIREYTTHHRVETLEEFNMVLIASSLVNEVTTLHSLRQRLTDQTLVDVAIRNAAAVCILPAIVRGHHETLRILLGMAPYLTTESYIRRPSSSVWSTSDSSYYALNDVSTRLLQLAYKTIPGAVSSTETVKSKKFGMSLTSPFQGFHARRNSELISEMLIRCSFSAFVRWHKNEDDEEVLPMRAPYHVQFVHWVREWIPIVTQILTPPANPESPVFRSMKQQRGPFLLSHQDTLYSTFGWGTLLRYICPLHVALDTTTPLPLHKTRVLQVALSVCSPSHAMFRPYLGKLLISIVSAAWDDSSEIGYELESKRDILQFLESSSYPLHTALLATSQLRKRAKQAQYFRNEYSTLSEWLEEQCKGMLDHCTTQQEANAMLFEMSRVENDSKWNRTPESETSALFLAIETKNESVVSSKWFQGTNKRPIWFYQWWRKDSYPLGTESVFGRVNITTLLFVELILLMPLFCVKPFSLRVTVYCKSLGINSAYFKFMQYTLFYCLFVFVVVRAATDHNLTEDKHGVQSVMPFSTLEIVMYTWILGFALSEMQSLFLDSMAYFRSRINKYDIFFITLFCIAFVFRWNSIKDFGMHDLEWAQTDLMVSDSALAAGSMVVVFRLTHLSSYHPRLGPLYESILKMSRDIYLFFFILVVIMMAAAVGFAFLLRRYGQRSADEVGEAASWASPYNAFWLLGKMMFEGEVPSDVYLDDGYDVIVWNTFNVIYLLVVVIVLTNLLIAMMNKTYERTHDSALKVYLNGRMQLINDYADLPIVPPPLNILTAPFEFLGAIVSHIRFGNSRAISLVSTDMDRILLLEQQSRRGKQMASRVVPFPLQARSPSNTVLSLSTLHNVPSAVDTNAFNTSDTSGSNRARNLQQQHRLDEKDSRLDPSSAKSSEWSSKYKEEIDKNRLMKERILAQISRNNYRRKVRVRVMHRYFATAKITLQSDAIPDGMKSTMQSGASYEERDLDTVRTTQLPSSLRRLGSWAPALQSQMISTSGGLAFYTSRLSSTVRSQYETAKRPTSAGAQLMRPVRSESFSEESAQ